MITIKIKDRDIPLVYTVWEMKQIQEEIAPLHEAVMMVCGVNPEDEKDFSKRGGKEQLTALAKMLRIMGNAGLEEAGEEPNLTDKKVLRGLSPSKTADAVNTVMNAIRDGMSSEIPPKEEDGPVDVVLEELNKKKDPES
jgi:hypothetical protein